MMIIKPVFGSVTVQLHVHVVVQEQFSHAELCNKGPFFACHKLTKQYEPNTWKKMWTEACNKMCY